MTMYQDLAMILDKFPRQFANPKRRDVNSLEELLTLANQQNGKKRCFTSVYNYTYGNRMPTIDRAFFDLDLGDYGDEENPETGEKCFNAAKMMFLYLKKKDWKSYSQFSGGGFHFVVFTEVIDDRDKLRDFMQEVADDLVQHVVFDTTSFGDIARIYPILYTMNVRRGRYVIPLSEREYGWTYEKISEIAKGQYGQLHIYGNQLAKTDGNGNGNSHQQFDQIDSEEFQRLKSEVNGDKLLSSMPQCLAMILKKGNPKYQERGVLLSYLIPKFANRELIKTILKKYLENDKYMHCVMPGHVYCNGKPCENQLEYMFRKFETGNWFSISHARIKTMGLCNDPKCNGDLYKEIFKK